MLALTLALLRHASIAWAQEAEDAEVQNTHAAKAKLAADFNDPLTTLPQLFIQDAYTPVSYGTEAPTNRVIARLIVPRIPRFSLFPFVQLIRPSFSLVADHGTRGIHGRLSRIEPLVGKSTHDWVARLRTGEATFRSPRGAQRR